MNLNESIVEDAALILPGATLIPAFSHGEKEWELGYAVGHGPQLAPGEYAGGTLTPVSPSGRGEGRGHPAAEPGQPRRGAGNDLELPDTSN